MSRTGVAIAVLSLSVAACNSGDGRPALPDAAHTPDAKGDDGATFACASPQDCFTHLPGGPQVYCCLDGTCVYPQRCLDGVCINPQTGKALCTIANVQLIQASNYDQSCAKDSDCVAVSVGNACLTGFLNCPGGAAINVGAMGQYNADVAKTNAAICGAIEYCPVTPFPCCVAGSCVLDFPCPSADAEGGTGSADSGTSDAPAGD